MRPERRSEMRSEMRSRDEGFTIVELLVVLAVMATLAAMTVFTMGPLQDRSAVNGGAAMLQTWLNTARQRAIRDKAPAGLRFLAGNSLPTQSSASGSQTNAYYVTRMVYLEGGTELFGSVWINQGGNTGSATTFTLTTPLGTTANPLTPPLAANLDTIVIDTGLPHMITNLPGSANVVTQITIGYSWPSAIVQAAPVPFRIIRGPTAITTGADSENILQMPRGSCVNFNPVTTNPLYPGGIDLGNAPVNSNLSNTFTYIPTAAFSNTNGIDIMFAPDGTVISPPSTTPIVFWVCSTTAVNPTTTSTVKDPTGAVTFTAGTPVIEAMRGNPSLVAVTPRTGQVISYPVEIDQLTQLPNGTVVSPARANATKDVQ
jgi:prepilin-type N-terminal cleavage/methylation domain-containing protein